ncbi:hypothetical protein EDB89DRAFT_2230519 [Lactarius sanguifluus]|nr:hypothetical protein EDB89DRAFT_2230519 [Lactarius sanguifluus]
MSEPRTPAPSETSGEDESRSEEEADETGAVIQQAESLHITEPEEIHILSPAAAAMATATETITEQLRHTAIDDEIRRIAEEAEAYLRPIDPSTSHRMTADDATIFRAPEENPKEEEGDPQEEEEPQEEDKASEEASEEDHQEEDHPEEEHKEVLCLDWRPSPSPLSTEPPPSHAHVTTIAISIAFALVAPPAIRLLSRLNALNTLLAHLASSHPVPPHPTFARF